jgi:hypothetical protein
VDQGSIPPNGVSVVYVILLFGTSAYFMPTSKLNINKSAAAHVNSAGAWATMKIKLNSTQKELVQSLGLGLAMKKSKNNLFHISICKTWITCLHY